MTNKITKLAKLNDDLQVPIYALSFVNLEIAITNICSYSGAKVSSFRNSMHIAVTHYPTAYSAKYEMKNDCSILELKADLGLIEKQHNLYFEDVLIKPHSNIINVYYVIAFALFFGMLDEMDNNEKISIFDQKIKNVLQESDLNELQDTTKLISLYTINENLRYNIRLIFDRSYLLRRIL